MDLGKIGVVRERSHSRRLTLPLYLRVAVLVHFGSVFSLGVRSPRFCVFFMYIHNIPGMYLAHAYDEFALKVFVTRSTMCFRYDV